MNAIIGDNGIITRAQEASVQNSIASLEEYLQLKYTENYEKMSKYKGKIEGISNEFSEYFYDPRSDGFGNVNYITDTEGHALYLIKKSGLPNEIREGIINGDCGQGKEGIDRYIDYMKLNDVYGVTSNLKVYYFGLKGELYGISSNDELDNDTTSRVVLDSSKSLAGILKNDGSDVTLADIQSVKNLTIDSKSGIDTLNDLYVLTSLESLTLKDLNLKDLQGISGALQLNYILMENCIVSNYDALADVSKLTYLYMYGIDDTELLNLCKGIKDATYTKLQYMAIVGNESWINSTDKRYDTIRSSAKYITNLTPLKTLTSSCVGQVKYLSLTANEIADVAEDNGNKIYALENLSQFNNLYLLRVEGNKLTSLKGLENLNNLTYLWACYNDLGTNEMYNSIGSDDSSKGKNNDNSLCALNGKENLFFLNLEGNKNLKWVGYLSTCSSLKNLYFGDDSDGCIQMIDSEVALLREVFSRCGGNKSYPGKYWLSLLDKQDQNLTVNANNQDISEEQFKMIGTYSNIKYLNLENVNVKKSDGSLITEKEAVNTLVNEVLKNIKNLQYLNMNTSVGKSFCNWNSLEFLKGVDENSADDDINLLELDAFGTKLSTKEEKNGKWESYDNGLKMLVTKRVDLTTDYCDNLGVLYLNESHIDLGEINDFVKRIICNIPGSVFGGLYRGLYIDSKEAMESLKNCSGLTRVQIWKLDNVNWTIDFSKQNTMTYFGLSGYTHLISTVIFPDNLSSLGAAFSANTKTSLENLKSFSLDLSWSGVVAGKNVLKTISNDSVLKSLRWSNNDWRNTFDFNVFKDVSTLSNKTLNVNSFYFGKTNNVVSPLNSLAGLEYLHGLTSLEIASGSCGSISDISALVNHKSTITKISIPNNAISDIHILSDFSKLTYLDLEKNCLAPYVELSEQNNTKWFTVKEICSRMRSNITSEIPKVTLKLKNNSAITDWGEFTNDMSKWTADSTYGNDI